MAKKPRHIQLTLYSNLGRELTHTITPSPSQDFHKQYYRLQRS